MNKIISKKEYNFPKNSKENDNSSKKGDFIKQEHYKNNFIKSEEAIKYVREELGIVSTNRKIEERKLRDLLLVEGKFSKIDYDYAQVVNTFKDAGIDCNIYNKFPSEVKDFEEKLGGKGCLLKILVNAKIHRVLNVGNCGPLATVAFDYLANKGVRDIELVCHKDIDHVFLIIGRDPNTDINDPKTWQNPEKPFWVCDPWESKIWPGNQYIEDYDMYQPIRDKEKYEFTIEASLPEGASWGSLESLDNEEIQKEISSMEDTVLKNCVWIKHSKRDEYVKIENLQKEMFIAARKKNLVQHLKVLKENGSSLEEIKKILLLNDDEGDTALNIAARKGYLVNVLEALYKIGFSVDQIKELMLRKDDRWGDTPLHVVARKGDLVNVVEELYNSDFEGDQLEELLLQRNNNGDTPLGDARNYEHEDSVKTVIDYLKMDGLSSDRIEKLR